ncbi:MAG TPA: AAA family ATPase [Actinophytocola sp.]|nr:AAA family ATPase [Actinophytocola sp.]
MHRRPRFPDAMVRPRLTAAGQAPCVVLTAPAGGGKTVLATQLADTAARVVWLRPAGPGTSASRLVDSARRILGVEPGPPAVDPAVLAESLLDAAAGEPLLLVVDEADRADAADLARWLAETVPLLDAGSGVLVCARDRPAGLVGRLGTAVRTVDAATLAFTEAEVAELLVAAGRPEALAGELHAATGGWPAAVAAGVLAGPGGAVVEALTAAVADDPGCRTALDLLSLVPAAPLSALGAAAERLAARSPLVQYEDGHLRLAEPARRAWRAAVRPDPAALARFGDAMAESDPATAVDLLLDAGEPVRATDVLAGAVGRLPVSWVRPRLYRLPAALRRSLPPALSAVQATVDLDSAVAHAERAVALAATPAAHAAARFALGSALAHRGELELAVVELAAARRGAQDPATAAAADSWLGLVRLWLGDLSGAAAAAAGTSAMDSWVLGECALARGDLAAAGVAAKDATARHGDLGPAVGQALAARIAVHTAGRVGAGGPGSALAEQAYRSAVERGGLELLAAAGVHGWFLLAAGRLDEAAAVADTVRRSVGRQDAASRLQAALLTLAVARQRGDDAVAHRVAADVSALRQQGFAVLAQEAYRFAPGLAGSGPGLRVRLAGAARVEVAGRVVADDGWRSRRAREVLLALAAAGSRGLRRDELVEALWPGREPGRGRTLLRTALAEVRRTLEPDRPAGEPSAYLLADRERVTLVAQVDLAAAREHAAAGRPEDVLALLAADLAAGEPDLAALADARAEAAGLRLRAAAEIGRDATRPPPSRAAAYEAVLTVEPWRQDLAEELVAMWWRAGDAARATDADRRWLTG